MNTVQVLSSCMSVSHFLQGNLLHLLVTTDSRDTCHSDLACAILHRSSIAGSQCIYTTRKEELECRLHAGLKFTHQHRHARYMCVK